MKTAGKITLAYVGIFMIVYILTTIALKMNTTQYNSKRYPQGAIEL